MVDFGVKFAKDFEFGDNEETRLLAIVKNKFGEDIKRTSKDHIFDYYNDECLIELKSRNCFSFSYPSSMVGYNKIQSARKSGKSCYFLFNFKDGLYYWEFNEDDITNGSVCIKTGGRKDRGFYEYKDYAFIDVDLLKEISI